jgi:hypothetical protein
MTQTLMALLMTGQVIVTQAGADPNIGSEPITTETAPATPSADERVVTVEGKVSALEEQTSVSNSDLEALKKLKISGYVQPRFVVNTGSKHGVDAKGAPAVKDGFTVRRGRLKAVYTGAWSQFLLQIDAVPSGVKLKDAEAWLFEPWTGHRLALVAGQTKWPFGYEVPQSSGDREFSERTRVVRAFLPGERDRGAKITGKLGPVVLAAGVFDGNGTETKVGAGSVVGVDNDRFKDVIGRVGVDLDFLTAGVSGWFGKTRQPAGADIKKEDFDRTRLGADLQLYLDLLPIGATAIKGEYIQGTTWAKDGIEQFDKKGQGYYALATQSLTDKAALAVRYDWFDGDVDADDVADAADSEKPASSNAVATLGVAALYYVDETYKVTVAYEKVTTGTPESVDDPDDDVFTVQLQAKF